MWSPQRYRKAGKLKGIPDAVLDEAIRQIGQANSHTPPLPPILSLPHLARISQTDKGTLRDAVSRKLENPYRHFYIRKRSGGYRLISVPQGQLQATQAWIAQNMLNRTHAHRASRAFAKGDSIVKCAATHARSNWLVKIDIADFFGSITEIQVYRAFNSLGYNPLVSFEMARICTERIAASQKYEMESWQVLNADYSIPDYQQKVLGRLPQGAPTSPMLSNLVMRPIDRVLQKLAAAHNLRYTRYSDDITFSTDGEYSREKAAILIAEAARFLKQVGLFLNRRKTRVVPPGAKKIVLGLLVDGPQPNLTKEFKDNIRQHLYYLRKFGIHNHVVRRKFDSVGGLYRHLLGLINFANMVDAAYASEARDEFNALPWPGT